MAGLFGLFGKKAQYIEEIDPNAPTETVKKEAFFLETDDAKSLGNAEYMRTPVQIRRSFPKTLNSQGAEVVKEVSAMEAKKVQSNGEPAPAKQAPPTGTVSNPIPVNDDRRSKDDSLDVFRKMAKELKN